VRYGAFASPAAPFVLIVKHLGFVYDGRTLYVRVMCPHNRTQPLKPYAEVLATKARWNREYAAKQRAKLGPRKKRRPS